MPKFSQGYLEEAHKHTIFNEQEVKRSNICTCFYCGYQFDPKTAGKDDYWEEGESRDKTLACPMCGIDSVVGDASGFPITDPDFMTAASEDFFGGISRISDNLPIEKFNWVGIKVE